MKRHALALVGLLSIAACAAPPQLQEYSPVTDPASPAAARYASDLQACRATATAAEADYKKRQSEEMAANMISGLLVGAILGAAVGNSDTAAYGAGYGAVSGAAATDTELAQGGPRRIVDRCMTGRGHVVLSDLGRG